MYTYVMRDEIPQGFKSNDRFPELPAITSYLNQFQLHKFSSVSQFEEKVMSGLERRLADVPFGEDPKLRTGLYLESLPEEFTQAKGIRGYSVNVKATNGPGLCGFGFLKED
jgi:hypothetical protein